MPGAPTRARPPSTGEDVVPKVLHGKRPPSTCDRGEGIDEVPERGAVGEHVVVSKPEEHAVAELGDLDGEQGSS
jgi:hypothetical protein